MPTMRQDKSPDNLFQISFILPPTLLTWVFSTIWLPCLHSEDSNIEKNLRTPPVETL